MASGEMSEAAFTQFLATALKHAAAPCRPGAVLFVAMDWRHLDELSAARRANGLELLNVCVWDKGQGGMGSLYRSQHELILVLKKAGAAHANLVQLGKNGRNRTNVWDYPGANASREGREDLARHPTPKPVAMVADALLDVTRPGEVVLDPFCGGGTLLIAAQRIKRLARAIELDPLYVDAAVRRWQAETGEAALCAASGERFDDRASAVADRSDTSPTTREAAYVG
jgi:DNA modification methylase